MTCIPWQHGPCTPSKVEIFWTRIEWTESRPDWELVNIIILCCISLQWSLWPRPACYIWNLHNCTEVLGLIVVRSTSAYAHTIMRPTFAPRTITSYPGPKEELVPVARACANYPRKAWWCLSAGGHLRPGYGSLLEFSGRMMMSKSISRLSGTALSTLGQRSMLLSFPVLFIR